jgi:hypothetical protein
MSSSLRSKAVRSGTTKFHHIKTAGYFNDNVGSIFPVPFSLKNGVVDINIEDDVDSELIENETPGTFLIEGLCKDIGGVGVATTLGPNFIRWLNNWVSDELDNSVLDTFSVYIPSTMTKVQITDEDSDDFDVMENIITNSPYGISSDAPNGDNYINGNASNNYRTCWIFKTPLTIKFTDNGDARYLTYNTTFAPVYDPDW